MAAYLDFAATLPKSWTPNVLARNRTWSTTFAKSRANPAHSEDDGLVCLEGIEPSPRHSQSRMLPATTQTPSISAPTRSRTRNASFEARYDLHFTTGAERKVRESNPHHPQVNRLSRAARPTVSGYLP
jgi:hypothetical protein